MLDSLSMVASIIPAAGTASRMGMWKPLLEVYGKPMLFHVLDALSPIGPVILVTGYRGDEMEAAVAPNYPGIRFARNPNYQQGMFSSILEGMRRLGEAELFLIAHADMPLLRHAHAVQLLSVWESLENGADVLRPQVDGIPGHPVLCKRKAAETALRSSGLVSMEQVLSCLTVHIYRSSDRAYITDIDTPEALLRL